VFKEETNDWKDSLSPEAQQLLSDMFESAKRHKGAYIQADDVKVAQLWCAMIELKNDVKAMKEQVEKVSAPFRAMAMVGEAEKRQTIHKLISDIVKPTEKETNEATKKLVDSLMKF